MMGLSINMQNLHKFILVCWLICAAISLIPATSNAQESVQPCIPITTDNADKLALFYEAAEFSENAIGDPVFEYSQEMAWSPDSARLSLWGTNFDLDDPTSVSVSAQEHPAISAYLPDGTPLIFQHSENTLDILNGETGEPIHRLELTREYIVSPTLSQDGKLLTFGVSDDQIDYQVQIWDMTTGERLQVLEGHGVGIPVSEFAFSPDGELLASGEYIDTPRLWDIANGTLLYNLSDFGVDNHVWEVEFSPDGVLLAATTHGAVTLIDVRNLPDATPTYINENVPATEVFDLAFSLDGTVLALAGHFNGVEPYYFVEIWEVETRTMLNTWKFEEPVDEVTFSPNGCWLAITRNWEPEKLQLWRVD